MTSQGGSWSYLNLRLRPEVRNSMKKATRENGTTVQALFSAFCEAYIEDPSVFRIILDVKLRRELLDLTIQEPA